jgi:hypothetical protein
VWMPVRLDMSHTRMDLSSLLLMIRSCVVYTQGDVVGKRGEGGPEERARSHDNPRRPCPAVKCYFSYKSCGCCCCMQQSLLPFPLLRLLLLLPRLLLLMLLPRGTFRPTCLAWNMTQDTLLVWPRSVSTSHALLSGGQGRAAGGGSRGRTVSQTEGSASRSL